MGDNMTLNDDKKLFISCTIYIVLLGIAFLITISSSSAYSYFHWYLKRSNTNTNAETIIY